MMQYKINRQNILLLLCSIKIIGSESNIEHRPLKRVFKPIMSFNINSECLWHGSLDHNVSTCGFCVHEHTGEITEIYKNNTFNGLLIVKRKPLFDPALFISCFLLDMLRNLKAVDQNIHQNCSCDTEVTLEKEWLDYKNKIIMCFNTIAKKINTFIHPPNANQTEDIPEFIAKSNCSMQFLTNNINNQYKLNIAAHSNPIYFDNKAVIPKTHFAAELHFKQKASNQTQTTRKIISYLVPVLTLLSLPAHKSPVIYKPVIKSHIIETLISNIKNL